MLRRISVASIAALAATVSGLVRESALAFFFGTSHYADAVAVAIFLHDTVAAAFVTGGFSYAVVPLVARLRRVGDDSNAVRLIITASTHVALAASLIAVMAFAMTPSLVHLGIPDGDAQRATAMIMIVRWSLPALVIMTTASTIAAALPALSRFSQPSIGRLLWNAGILLGLVSVNRLGPPLAIAVALLIGALANLMVVGLSLPPFSGPRVQLRHSNLAEMVRAATPALLAVAAINTVLGLWERYLLVGIGVGSIAVINYAQRASYMASTISAAVHVVAFTEMAKHTSSRRFTPEGIEAIRKVSRRYLLFLVPTMCFMIGARRDIIALLFARGAFEEASLARTAAAFAVYATSIVPVFLVGLFIRAMFALENQWHAISILAVTALLSAIVDRALVPELGELSIPVGYSLGMLGGAALVIWRVGREVRVSFGRFVGTAIGTALCLGVFGLLLTRPLINALPFWDSCHGGGVSRFWCLSARTTLGFFSFTASVLALGYFLSVAEMRDGIRWVRGRLLQHGT